MFGKSICVLFSGKAGTGKSTSATYLYKKLAEDYDCCIASFAKGVKDVARNSFGWDGVKDDLGRELLIGIGNTGRAYNENIWASKTFDQIIPSMVQYPLEFVFVDDWRYPNEGNYVMKNGLYSVYTVRLIAPSREILKGTPAYDDISETSLDDYAFNYVIDNEGTMEELQTNLDKVIEQIMKKEPVFGG